MNSQYITPSQESTKVYGLYKYISLTALIKLLESYLDGSQINKLHIVVKYADLFQNEAFTGYNFDIAGIYLNGSDWTPKCPEMDRVLGLTLGEKRGKYLFDHFGESPFVIYQIMAYAMNIGSNDAFYGFTSSPINAKYYDMLQKEITRRRGIVDLGGVFIHDKEVEFLSSKRVPK